MLQMNLGLDQSLITSIFLIFMYIFFDNTIYPKKHTYFDKNNISFN